MMLIRYMLLMLVSAALAVLFFHLGLTAIEREQRYYDAVRAERCAQYGEDIPEEMLAYCEGLGV